MEKATLFQLLNSPKRVSSEAALSTTTPGGKGTPFPTAVVTSPIEINSTGCHFTQKRCFSLPFHDNSLSHGTQTQRVLLRRVEQTPQGAAVCLLTPSYTHTQGRSCPTLSPRRTSGCTRTQQELPAATMNRVEEHSRPGCSSPRSPFFLSSGLPFLTVAMTISPTPAAGSLFRRPLIPFTEMMYRFLAPVERRAEDPCRDAPPAGTPTAPITQRGEHHRPHPKAMPLLCPPTART